MGTVPADFPIYGNKSLETILMVKLQTGQIVELIQEI